MESKSVNIHHDVITRCKRGDRKAQHELFDLYHKAMYNTAYRIMADEEEAKDVLQDAFVSAFDHLNQYRADASFGAWLKRIVINKAINQMKKNQPREQMVVEEDEPYYKWEEVPDLQMKIESIKKAITELPAGFRNVMTLYLFEGYDHKEVAEILGITESTSKSQYNRAKKKVRERLNQIANYG